MRRHRERLGLDQETAAERWEISVRTIRAIENGRGASGKMLDRLGERIKVHWHDLLTDEARGRLGLPAQASGSGAPAPVVEPHLVPVANASLAPLGVPCPKPPSLSVGAVPLGNTKLVGRDALLGELVGLLCGFATHPAQDGQHVVSLQGMPGLGKTALAVAITYSPDVQSAFVDGIVWQSMGKQADPLNVVTRWCDQIGASHLLDGRAPRPGHPGRRLDTRDVGDRLRAHLLRTGQRILFILDDVWHASQIEPILIAGGGCASLLTTRLLPIAEQFAPRGQRKVPPRLSDEEGLVLLTDLVDPETVAGHTTECRELVRRLDGLPLALTVAGRLLAHAGNRGHAVGNLIEQLRERTDLLLREPAPPDVERFLRDVENPSVVAVLQLSTDELDDRIRECFAVLGDVAPSKEGTFSLRWMAAGWELSLDEARAVADCLVEAGLIQPATAVAGEAFYYMHDLLIQHAKTMIEPEGS